MDHNLDDSLNLESTIGVDFEHPEDTVVNQADITLQASGHEEGIPMEFEQIEEQPMLMDTGNEEIIVSDFMGDQFTLQEYSKVEPSEATLTTSQADEMIDLQFTTQPISVPASGMVKTISVPASGILSEETHHPKIISVQTGIPTMRAIAPKKDPVIVPKTTTPRQISVAPRQVAIAPKPSNLASGTINVTQYGKQYAIAPKPIKSGVKPVTLIANKKLTQVTKVTKDTPTGNAVLAIGKQLVMLPPGGAQKIKVVTAGSNIPSLRLITGNDSDKAQLIPNRNVQGAQNAKPVMTKVVVPGSSAGGTSTASVSSESDKPAILTRLVAFDGPGGQRLLTVHKPSQGAKLTNVILGSPTKSGVRYTKKLVAVKASTPAQGVVKKVVVSANPSQQNIVLSSTSQPKTTQITKLSQGLVAGQKTQLHPINVPGKGVQYIRLVTTMKQAKQVINGPQPLVDCPKKIVFTDNKAKQGSSLRFKTGNLVHMPSSQPPPLVTVTSGASTASVKVMSKPQQKLVKIAPVSSKLGASVVRSGGQSLLAPLSPLQPELRTSDLPELMEETIHSQTIEELPLSSHLGNASMEHVDPPQVQEVVEHEELDSKAALQQLIADAVGSDDDLNQYDQKIEYHENSLSMEGGHGQAAQPEHSLIVIPPTPAYSIKQDVGDDDSFNTSHNYSQNSISQDESNQSRLRSMINIEVDSETYNNYQPSTPPLLQDPEAANGEAGADDSALRRKACNCTKSQCLKLYCDCFASGEFCHGCNCNNCHNNLSHEHLRQKAIRGCLDRNPNAFRPKIGKSKTGGQEPFRRHNKGCNCKRSGCLKNYCECYEAKIACTNICRCVGCRNMEESLERSRRPARPAPLTHQPAPPPELPLKQPCSFMTSEVIEAVCQCLIAAAVESPEEEVQKGHDPIKDVIDEFSRCLKDIISASNQATPLSMYDETQS